MWRRQHDRKEPQRNGTKLTPKLRHCRRFPSLPLYCFLTLLDD